MDNTLPSPDSIDLNFCRLALAHLQQPAPLKSSAISDMIKNCQKYHALTKQQAESGISGEKNPYHENLEIVVRLVL